MTQAAPVVGALAETDLPAAQRIFRVAFGTFLGAPDPETFWSDRDYLLGRWHAPHVAALGARVDGALAGSNFLTKWGSVGFFGPLTVTPALQERGIAKALLATTMEQFDAWGTTQTGLFTFAQSTKHVALYQKFGFSARFLTALMIAPATDWGPVPGTLRFGSLSAEGKAEVLRASRDVTESLYPGLDLSDEIATVDRLGIGDTVLVEGTGGLEAFAICHYGPQSEAGAGTCFMKFGAVRATPSAAREFGRLIDAAGALASDAGMPTLMAGINLARHEAYEQLLARGFRSVTQGVSMHRRNEPGYCRPGVYVIDDWR